MVKSLASNKTDYVAIQLRAKGEDCCDTIKVQGRGIFVNRSYGVTGDVVADKAFVEWLNNIGHGEVSLADTSQCYVAAQVAIRGDSLHFQIPSPVAFHGVGGRGYGGVLNVNKHDFPELVDFIENANVDAIIFDNDDSGDSCCDGCCH